jgi:hypothetical protein
MESGIPALSIRLSIVALSFLLAWLTYRYIEVPIRFGHFHRRKSFFLFIFAVMICLSGLFIFLKEGNIFSSEKAKLISIKGPKRSQNCRQTHPEFTGGFCELTQKQPPSVLLIGDSHSAGLSYGLNEMAPGENILMMGGLSCLPFLDVTVFVGGAHLDHCKIVTDYIMNYALNDSMASQSIKTVIISTRGPLYLTGLGYGEFNYAHRVEIGSYSDPKNHNFKNIFEISLRNICCQKRRTKSRITTISSSAV